MNSKYLILTICGVLILVATIAMVVQAVNTVNTYRPVPTAAVSAAPTTSSTPGPPITREGMLVCLPHRDQTGPQTDECAIGLKANDGKYYGLADPDGKHTEALRQPTSTRLNVSGTLQKDEPVQGKYDVQGTIRLTLASIHSE
jgi:hypothetical protein